MSCGVCKSKNGTQITVVSPNHLAQFEYTKGSFFTNCRSNTIAVQLLKKTGNLRQVQKQLGHASPATTANMYADITFEDMQNGLNGLYQ